MPIFHQHRAILVHVPKTGGQSLAIALGCNRTLDELYGLDGDRELSHLTACELAVQVPTEWQTYYRFAFVRNPWDRFVSAYHYCQGRPAFADGRQFTFEDYIRELTSCDKSKLTHVQQRHILPQADYVFDEHGVLAVDEVGRFETFAADAVKIGRRLGIDLSAVPHINATEHAHYATYYTTETQDLVARYSAQIIAEFGYQFDLR